MRELLSDLDVGRRVLVALDVLAGDEQRVDEGDLRESAGRQVRVVLIDVHHLGRDVVAGVGKLVREGQYRLRAVDLPGDAGLVERVEDRAALEVVGSHRHAVCRLGVLLVRIDVRRPGEQVEAVRVRRPEERIEVAVAHRESRVELVVEGQILLGVVAHRPSP